MAAKPSKYVLTLVVDGRKLKHTITILPGLIMLCAIVVILVAQPSWGASDAAAAASVQPEASGAALISDNQASSASAARTLDLLAYPESGSQLNPNTFALQLPPPPLDAMPYDVRFELSNGLDVPVKKRWLWIPPGQAITVSETADGSLNVDVPVGSMWWKEFYIETDRGAFLIERRIIVRVNQSRRHTDGWAFYSSHYRPAVVDPNTPIVLSSLSDEAKRFLFLPTDWMPTQEVREHFEVRFEDSRGLQSAYVFPGQVQCTVCHAGASGAYPNDGTSPIQVFGFHPNNLTPASFEALVRRGWIRNGERLLTADYVLPEMPSMNGAPRMSDPSAEPSLEALTVELVGVMRNNCASCHNNSPDASGSVSAFVMDPNRAYTAEELLEMLRAKGRMVADANPLVVPGHPEQSELWLRLMGLDGRRRMPPVEGGLPDIDPRIVSLVESWIISVGQQTQP